MSVLDPLHAAPDVAVHAVRSEPEAEVSRVEGLVVSTEPSREICNRPEVLGTAFTRRLRRAVALALDAPPLRAHLSSLPEERFCVLHLLRGGLNFGLREALGEAYGFERHASSFLSSQRYHADGAWHVREDAYRKLAIPEDAILVLGDVVATGATLRHAMQTVLRHLEHTGARLSRVVCFTIGCEVLEEILRDLDAALRRSSPQFRGSTAVYLEGRFVLADERSDLRIVRPGTDLLRRDALLAPEFAWSQRESASYPLERCSIYDAGSRAFDVGTYLQDVRAYWQEVARLAHDGFTLRDALVERWTADPPTTWSPPRGFTLDSPAALAALCEERLATLDSR